MKASELVAKLQDFARRFPDGVVALAALETMPDFTNTGETVEIDDCGNEIGNVFLLYTENAMTEADKQEVA